MTIHDILKQAQALSPQERKELVKLLVDSISVEASPITRPRRLSDLRGLGREIWQDIDTQAYINDLRDEWDNRA